MAKTCLYHYVYDDKKLEKYFLCAEIENKIICLKDEDGKVFKAEYGGSEGIKMEKVEFKEYQCVKAFTEINKDGKYLLLGYGEGKNKDFLYGTAIRIEKEKSVGRVEIKCFSPLVIKSDLHRKMIRDLKIQCDNIEKIDKDKFLYQLNLCLFLAGHTQKEKSFIDSVIKFKKNKISRFTKMFQLLGIDSILDENGECCLFLDNIFSVSEPI